MLEIAAVPVYVLTHGLKYITEKELLVVLHFTAVRNAGKSAWVTVAERIGYTSLNHLENAVDSMVTKGAATRNGYSVDFTRLYNKCLALDTLPKSAALIETPAPVKAKKRQKNPNGLALYNRLEDALEGFNKWTWVISLENLYNAATGLKTYSNGKLAALSDDIVVFVKYIDSYYAHKYQNEVTRLRVRQSDMTLENYRRWLDAGKKETYTVSVGNGKVDFGALEEKLSRGS